MRLKNIAVALSATLITLTACVDESLITPPNQQGDQTTFSIKLAPEATITKADAALGYTYADADEIKVNNVALAIFKEGALVGFKYQSFTAASGTLTDKKPYYEITGIPAKTGAVSILAIANSSKTEAFLIAEAEKGQTAFEAIVEDNGGLFDDATTLVKFGTKNVTLTTTPQDILIPLTQLAARIDFGVTVLDSDSKYYITEMEIANGVNTTSTTFLKEYTAGYVHNTNVTNSSITITIDADKKTQKVTFYTYEKATAASPIKVNFTGALVEDPTAATPDYTDIREYELTLNPVSPTSATNGIVHGYFYDITGEISLTTQKITFTTTVMPWDQVAIPIGANIKEIHFLVVKETKVYMPNIETYLIDYRSDSKITISNVKATFVNYVLDDKKVKISSRTDNCTGDQIPTTPVVGNQIKVTSKLPEKEYPFPKNITFTVTNEAGLTENVTVTQYPPYYLTGEVSVDGGPVNTNKDRPDLSTNPNIFTITIVDAAGLKIGIPTGSDGQTLNTVDANNLVSPRFMVASRQAVVSSGTYTSNQAIARCADYWETLTALTPDQTSKDATYPPGTWRSPTLAELEFMNKIQDNSPSVNYLFNNSGTYWSALPAWYYDFGDDKRGKASSADVTLSGGGGARCVRDIY